MITRPITRPITSLIARAVNNPFALRRRLYLSSGWRVGFAYPIHFSDQVIF